MFESEVAGLDLAGTAEAFGFVAREKLRVGCEQLLLAAHWADLHPPVGLLPASAGAGRLVGERAMCFGAAGTPLVGEFAPAELAPLIQASIGQARSLIADATDLRQRFTRIWALVRRGLVADWAVRLIARSCRDLSPGQAGAVDRMLSGDLIAVGRRRLEHLLDAAMLRVDGERIAKLIAEGRRSRFVRVGQAGEHGIKAVYARLDAAEAIRLDAMVDRVADILAGADRCRMAGVPTRDAKTRDEWRAVAFSLLGTNPVRAAQLLIEHEQPDLFDALAELQQPPLRYDPNRNDIQPDHFPCNDPDGAPFDPDREPPVEESLLPPDPGFDNDIPADPGQWQSPDDGRSQDQGLVDDHLADEEPGCGQPQPQPAGDHDPADPTGRSDQSRPEPDHDPAGFTRDHEPTRPADEHDPAGSAGDHDSTEPSGEHDHGCGQRQEHSGPSADRLNPFLRQEYRQEALRQLLRHLDPARLVSPAMLHVHYYPDDTTPIARVEELGSASLHQVRHWLDDCRINLLPVLDLNTIPAVDAYEVPPRLREAVFCRNPASLYPYSTTIGRTTDLDHTNPYRRRPDRSPAEPGQTALGKLAPLARPEHRYKTHGRISVRQPVPGTLVWLTRYGQVLITSAAGTQDLGTTHFARAVWHAAQPNGAHTTAA
ncbi:DUF222 domain-containing protein [Microlunatus elymi]|uniref:DUF222 domain-containing protein n=1 Tax=Microlunatus elymi TaxID=2596828 RepID=A0A516Q282_9ACTN|nr:DUF222 domain-containing protein [Microlunatus elymi]QDP97321.1 DUF222 domain-containing protein [Microlunatus elymi]